MVKQQRQHQETEKYYNIIVGKQQLMKNNIVKYRFVGKYRSLLGSVVIGIALLPLFSLWLLPIGLYLLGLPIRLLLISKYKYMVEGFYLW